MVFYENGKKVRYNPYHMKFDKKVENGEGVEVVAYKVGNEVVKFYKEYCGKKRLTKEECEYLSLLLTERILLPKVSLLDKKHQIRGYKMTYIEDLGTNSFYTLNRKDLSKEMTLVHKDLIHLSNQQVLIEDLNVKNTVFHKGIYLVDPGSFQIDKSQKENNDIRIYGMNMDVMNEYLLDEVIEQCCLNVSKSNKKELMSSIKKEMREKDMDTLTFLKDGMEEDSILDMIINKYHDLESSHEKPKEYGKRRK